MEPQRPRGWIHEIFCSIQGEGIYCGCCQTFVRFAGCNIACSYCDTPLSREPRPDACRVEPEPGTGRFEKLKNPLSADDVLATCSELPANVVALTGGEPLLQDEFLESLMRQLKERDYSIYLETNGTLWQELKGVIALADVIAMDVKTPGATGGPEMWDSHARFLRIASRSEVFAKAVVDGRTSEEEIRRCAELIAVVDRGIPLVIQPATGRRVPASKLMFLQRVALELLADVRVIPQCHKAMGLL